MRLIGTSVAYLLTSDLFVDIRSARKISIDGGMLVNFGSKLFDRALAIRFSFKASQHVGQRRRGGQAQHRQGLLGHCG